MDDVQVPNCIDTELEILAMAMYNRGNFYDLTAQIKKEQFYFPEIGRAFDFIVKLDQKGKPTDPVTVAKECQDDGALTAILKASTQFVSADRVGWLMQRFQEYYLRRVYYLTGKELMQLSMDSSIPPSQLMDTAESRIFSVHTGEERKEIIEPKEAAIKALDLFYERAESTEPIGIPLTFKSELNITLGYPGIEDALAGGPQKGDLILIAAQSGEGKTALSLNLATVMSQKHGYRTYYQNTEMKDTELVYRVVSNLTGIPFREVLTGKLTGSKSLIEENRKKIEYAFQVYANSKLYLSELPDLTPNQSRGLARKFKHKYGDLDVLVIDYVGRMEIDEDSKGGRLREDQILAKITRESKKLAQKLDCAVILLAQLNEDNKLEGAKRMINDCDAVFFIEELTGELKKKFKEATHKLVKRKVRRGDKKKPIYLRFDKAIQRIFEVYTTNADDPEF